MVSKLNLGAGGVQLEDGAHEHVEGVQRGTGTHGDLVTQHLRVTRAGGGREYCELKTLL